MPEETTEFHVCESFFPKELHTMYIMGVANTNMYRSLTPSGHDSIKTNVCGTVHPRLSEQVEFKFLLGRSDTQTIRIIEEEHFTY